MNTEAIQQRLISRREELRARELRANTGLKQQPDLSSADYGDISTESERNGILSALSRTADAELKRIDDALQRLAEGRYTTCIVCGEEIEPQRLEAVPYTDRCVACADRSAGEA
ncbi:MAG TPA: TraR/DksA C4-type zinc finger protein [Steroidobacteraceae bacterium]|nr:TraR/DksA C4-type zinc finger protein [Steroidobacteraceae bacterium]